jgi:Universal stress protein family
MRGTLLCAVSDGEESADALVLGAQLSDRLGLRLVLAHAVDGINGIGDEDESVTMKANREGAERRLARLAEAHGLAERAERRVGVGEPAALIGQIAAEEGADVIRHRRTRTWLAQAPRKPPCRRAGDGDAGPGSDCAATDAQEQNPSVSGGRR